MHSSLQAHAAPPQTTLTNPLQATMLGMKRSVDQLLEGPLRPDACLVDGNRLPKGAPRAALPAPLRAARSTACEPCPSCSCTGSDQRATCIDTIHAGQGCGVNAVPVLLLPRD